MVDGLVAIRSVHCCAIYELRFKTFVTVVTHQSLNKKSLEIVMNTYIELSVQARSQESFTAGNFLGIKIL